MAVIFEPQQPPAVSAVRLLRGRRRAAWRATAAVTTVAISLSAVAAPPAQAQSSGNGFLFQQPTGSFTIRGGLSHPTAGGDLFSFVTDQLTLNKSDFSGPTIGADVAFSVAPRLDITLGTSYSGTSSNSSYRKLVDQNNAEITQVTDFRRVPVMLSLKAYLTPQGRSIGRFAWVPARLAPYVGIGGGAMWYQFKQTGSFVDFQNNNNVFDSELASSRWTPAAQGMAGLDLTLTPRVALTGEARYIWAQGSPNQSFAGFRTIDLSGLSATAGLTFRY